MIVLKNLKIVNPVKDFNGVFNIAIKDGIIIDIYESELEKKEYKDFQQFDLKGKVATPSFVDIHVHLRDPGYEYKEDIFSGAEAAKKGGFTDICCMANTNPVNDNEEVVKYILKKGKETKINIYPVAAITKGLKGESLTEFGNLIEAGAIALSDDGVDIRNAFLLKTAFEYAKFFNVPILCHCENLNLATGFMRDGKYSTLAGIMGNPSISEEINVFRNIKIAEYTGSKVHICHISSKGSVEIIRFFKNKDVNVTCEVTPHHLSLTDKDVYESDYDTNFKMNPPLGTEEDKEILIESLSEGIIDCVATDHAPHAEHEKLVEFEYAPNGIIGLETAFPVCYQLVLNNKITLKDLIYRMTIKPAEIVGIEKGEIEIGAKANITIIDIELEKVYTKDEIKSKSKNSPFIGRKFKGWPIMTISKGEVVFISQESGVKSRNFNK